MTALLLGHFDQRRRRQRVEPHFELEPRVAGKEIDQFRLMRMLERLAVLAREHAITKLTEFTRHSDSGLANYAEQTLRQLQKK